MKLDPFSLPLRLLSALHQIIKLITRNKYKFFVLLIKHSLPAREVLCVHIDFLINASDYIGGLNRAPPFRPLEGNV
jgi:hypothetical protein